MSLDDGRLNCNPLKRIWVSCRELWCTTLPVTRIYPYRTAGLSSIKDVIDPAESLFSANCLRWLHFCSVPDNGNMVIYARVMKTKCAQSVQLQNALCPALAALPVNFECTGLHIGTTEVFEQLNSFVHIILECVYMPAALRAISTLQCPCER